MKNVKFFSLLAFAIVMTVQVKAQHENYIRISADAGLVANTDRDGKFALGGTVSWLTQDNLIALSEYNYITLGVKGINNPYGDGKILSSIGNDKDDAFNYIGALAGYRFTQEGVAFGLYAEPRIGAAFGADGYAAFLFSPIVGYAYNYFDFSAFCDMGFGGKNSAIGKKNFFTVGVSVAYNIGL